MNVTKWSLLADRFSPSYLRDPLTGFRPPAFLADGHDGSLKSTQAQSANDAPALKEEDPSEKTGRTDRISPLSPFEKRGGWRVTQGNGEDAP